MWEELLTRYGTGRTIFVDHCNDLFAEDVPREWIMNVLNHCAQWLENTYVYQTKNPGRYVEFLRWMLPTCMLGCTIETNRDILNTISCAPRPVGRFAAMQQLNTSRILFVTIEPIMDFDVDVLAEWIRKIGPEFVNIGADSKGHNLPEPPAEKIFALIDLLDKAGIEIRAKHNLERILGKEEL
jgi:DNA repair photolyase